MSNKQLINKIVKLKENGLSYQQISDDLNKNKIQTISGKGKWHRMSVSRAYIKGIDSQVETISLELKMKKQEKNKLIEELSLVKQKKTKMIKDELNRIKQIEINANATKQENAVLKEKLLKMDRIKKELNKELNKVKQELLVKQKDKQQETSKGINIDGWSVQKSGGYYRMFKKINGKVHGIYLGKYLDQEKARKRIKRFKKMN